MREIKFRGFGTDDQCKRWIYGSLLDERSVGIVAIQDENCHVYAVEPESVGQYTGLLDCERREICEGDIVKFELPPMVLTNKKTAVGVVVYEYGQFLVIIHAMRFTIFSVINDCTVIGNIHDNSDLLTYGKE